MPPIIISVTEFRRRLTDILQRVHRYEDEYIITTTGDCQVHVGPVAHPRKYESIPSPGFYIHFKHNPEGEVGNGTYEVLGCGEDVDTGIKRVWYRPLYNVPGGELRLFNRTLHDFVANTVRGGKIVPRFDRVTDPVLIKLLVKLRSKLYPAI